jgi:hypothetical protein
MNWDIKFEKGFYIFTRNGKEIYDFPNTKCDTEQKVNEWIAHLTEKNWWNEELEKQFIELWKIENNYNE